MPIFCCISRINPYNGATMMIDHAIAVQTKSWPFQEALRLAERYAKAPPSKGHVLFETGYGPSGLPHIGTFGEVARTSMVREAFRRICDIPTRLICFSDDMDGLRKVPENVPNQEMLLPYIAKKPTNPDEPDMIGGVSLTSIPDPFGTHKNFGAHMNARLMAFLDKFGFEYEFKSSTECYKSGLFDKTLLAVLRNHEKICSIVRPTLSEVRRNHYSPFLPVDPKTSRPLHVDIVVVDVDKGIIRYQNPLENNIWMETEVTGGHCKLQWKADWGMRWAALGVDYEMSGKDLISSVELSTKICSAIGSNPPQGFTYELFLDEKGQKISKSKGNGITIDEWLRYAPHESLSYYMFQTPRRAKKLYFDVIPQQVDDYLSWLEKYDAEPDEAKRLDNPVWHIHSGHPPKPEKGPKFSLLLNLAVVSNPKDKSALWAFISRYMPDVTPQTSPFLDRLAGYAVTYYNDFIKPAKKYRAPTDIERQAMQELHDYLVATPNASADDMQNEIYAIGKKYPFSDLKLWFAALYEVLLGQPAGPRMGPFIALYGRVETIALLARVLKGENLAA